MVSPPLLRPDEKPVETLRQWLSDKPYEWGPALALRLALRLVPWSIGHGSKFWIERYTLPLFHSLFVSWSTSTGPIKGHKLAAELSTNLLYPAAMFHEKEAYFASAMRNIASAISAKLKADKVDHSVRAIVALNSLVQTLSENGPTQDFVWDSISSDIAVLLKHSDVRNVNVRQLMHSKLVEGAFASKWKQCLTTSLDRVIETEPSFEVWTAWLSEAFAGKQLNFFNADDSPDAKVKDRRASANIIQERSSQFWSRSPSAINEDVAHWIASAAEGLLTEDDKTPQLPPQNENAISFQANSSGKIELSGALHYDALRDDSDTQDRYEECMTLANDLLDRCKGSNSAIRLTQMLTNYVDAAGINVASLRPSLFVQRGERLRQELAAYQVHDTLLPPIADDILLDLRAWKAAHNMLVGLDPALMARDTALMGPDARVASAGPKEIRDFAIDADEAGILADNVVEIVVEATDLAPEVPDATNRRTIWSFETGRNLVIEAFNLAFKHPGKSAVGAIISGAAVTTLGPAGTVVSLAAGSIPAAKFLLQHRKWIETRLGDSPTWQGLFGSLCEWLEECTPLQHKKD